MQYEHDDDIITVKSDNGVELKMFFGGDYVYEWHLDGNDYPATGDTAHGVYLMCDGKLKKVSEIIRYFEDRIDAIREQHEIEQQAEEDNAAFLSSPGKTGRI